jgi:hypothetical protein
MKVKRNEQYVIKKLWRKKSKRNSVKFNNKNYKKNCLYYVTKYNVFPFHAAVVVVVFLAGLCGVHFGVECESFVL